RIPTASRTCTSKPPRGSSPAARPDVKVGFIGLGNLGRHLAARALEAGFPVCVHDLDAAAVAGLVSAGASAAASPRGVAEASDCVITCLPSPAAVQAVVAGAGGALE